LSATLRQLPAQCFWSGLARSFGKVSPEISGIPGCECCRCRPVWTAEDFFDAIYQYPGGWLADHWGRKRAFLIFLAAAVAGYFIYLSSAAWPYLFLGLAFAMAWQAMGSPAMFATIGDALPKERRSMGFTIQSTLKRIPMVISPLIGGAMIGALGLQKGIRTGLLVSIGLAAVAAALLSFLRLPAAVLDTVRMSGVWDSFHPTLKRLLASDIVIRMCEGMADIFVVLYVTNVSRVTIPKYGVLVAIQLMTAILIYVPRQRLRLALAETVRDCDVLLFRLISDNSYSRAQLRSPDSCLHRWGPAGDR